MAQPRAARKQETARTPKSPRTYKEAMNGNVHPINGDSNSSGKNSQAPERKVSEADVASEPCTQCGKKSLPWGRVVCLDGNIAHVCGAECQAKFDKERSEKISDSYKLMVETVSQMPAESPQPIVDANRRRSRPAEQTV